MENYKFKEKPHKNKITMLRYNLKKRNINLTDHQLNLILNLIDINKRYYLNTFNNKEIFDNTISKINQEIKDNSLIEKNKNKIIRTDKCLIEIYSKDFENEHIEIYLLIEFQIKSTSTYFYDDKITSLYIGQWRCKNENI